MVDRKAVRAKEVRSCEVKFGLVIYVKLKSILDDGHREINQIQEIDDQVPSRK